MISGLGEAFEDVRTKIVREEGVADEVKKFSSKLTHRLLDVVFTRLKLSTKQTRSTDAVSVEYQKFLERR